MKWGPLLVGHSGCGAAQITYAYHTPWTPAAGIFYAWGPSRQRSNLLCVGGKEWAQRQGLLLRRATRYGPAGIPIGPSPERLKYLLRVGPNEEYASPGPGR